MFKKFAFVSVAVVSLFVLSGCTGSGSPWETTPADPSAPLSASDAGYETYHLKLDNNAVLTCFEDGSGRSRVVACFEGGQDYEDTVTPSEAGFDITYVDGGQGTTVACLTAGSGRSRVATCVPYTE